jgi:hypothetical protein
MAESRWLLSGQVRGRPVDLETLRTGRIAELHSEPVRAADEAELAEQLVRQAAAGDGDLDGGTPVRLEGMGEQGRATLGSAAMKGPMRIFASDVLRMR